MMLQPREHIAERARRVLAVFQFRPSVPLRLPVVRFRLLLAFLYGILRFSRRGSVLLLGFVLLFGSVFLLGFVLLLGFVFHQ